MITVKSTQKIFTEDEISILTGICTEHLRAVARSKHLGRLFALPEPPEGRWSDCYSPTPI